MSDAEAFEPADYELIDFGDGRRLERFAGVIVDRPCPTAEGVARRALPQWREAIARFDREPGAQHGRWTFAAALPEPWTMAVGPLRLALRCTPFGQVGLFPEHARWWWRLPEWLASAGAQPAVSTSALVPRSAPAGENTSAVPDASATPNASAPPIALAAAESSVPHEAVAAPTRLRVLHLFAYTGAGTLAAARCGAEVVHVDAAKNMLAHARTNAELSGLHAASIRWIAEDALKFVKRELRRGAEYEAVILDPPSYGHGPRGEVWRLAKHLPRLLDLCAELTAAGRRLIVLTCHTPGYGPARLAEMLSAAAANGPPGRVQAEPLWLSAADGRRLPCGAMAAWRASAFDGPVASSSTYSVNAPQPPKSALRP